MKTKKKWNFWNNKMLVLILIMALLIFFGRSLKMDSLVDTAFALGLGIEKNDLNEYVVSVQINLPPGSEETTSNAFAVYTSTGNTVSTAFANLGEQIGYSLSLAHCNVIISTPDILTPDFKNVLDNLMIKWFLPSNSVMVATTQKTSEILSSKVPAFTSSAFFLQSIMMKSFNFGTLPLLTVKDFLFNSYSKSHTSGFCLLERKKLPSDAIVSSDACSQAEQNGEGDSYVFKLSDSLIVGENFKPFVLNEEISECVRFFTSTKLNGSLETKFNQEHCANFLLLNGNGKIEIEKNKITAKVKMDLVLRELSNYDKETISFMPLEDIEKVKKATEKIYTERFKQMFAISQEKNADFLHIANTYWQKFGTKEFENENFLKSFVFEPTVEIEMKNT